MNSKIFTLTFFCLYICMPMFAQEPAKDDKQTLFDQFHKKISFVDFSEVLKQFNEVTLPISSSAEQFTKAPDLLKGKFTIDKTYVGLFVGNSISTKLFIYDNRGNYSDQILVYDYWDDFYYDYYSVVEFALSKDLILDISCEGDDCEDYPLKYKICNGKFVRQY